MPDTTVKKWGNSLAVRIPKDVAETLSINEGAVVGMEVVDNKITIAPKEPVKRYNLDDLLSGVTSENRHEEVQLGIEGNEKI
ncbi:AbrB/MazE/SpoVT family DNA-binding domain-containing protein [Salinicoccus luteus]|uniref:AbrB/MazE/SpoVT family DNA-binding domain-containing protein n=1 Tax=Salinicoccus luteus TaxID=367840 RepID=UPI0004E22E97|nr:AbrB/MazE/SpoVT family DNA-binding domain-containing protein [Salinicoccus luteus]